MRYETLLYDLSDGIAEIRLNRLQRLNAVTQRFHDERVERRARAAPRLREVRVVLLTGAGRAFCVGADLKEHKAGRSAFDRRQYLQGEQDVCRRLIDLKKPVVAAVNGYALGAGAEIALCVRLPADGRGRALGLPEISIGNFLGGGVTWLLPRLVGLAKARELVFLGERIGGEEAVRIGLANRVFADAGFLDEARAFARRIAAKRCSRWSSPSASSAFGRAHARRLPPVAELEGMMFVGTTRDWQEGVDAFAEKRAPVFRGK